jgi:sulfur relay (sulfurtransferase) DsrC/TusE family protein
MRATQLHYESGKNYDVIDFIKDYKLNFNIGNVVKYCARLGKKDKNLRELRKALDYLQREIEHEEHLQKLEIERLRGAN